MTDKQIKWTTHRDHAMGNTYLTPLPHPITRDEFDYEGATHVSMWYNRDERSWVVSYADEQGRQRGSSEYVYTRGEAEQHAEYLISRVCAACGWMESDYPDTRDNAHDSLCCGTTTCSWVGSKQAPCATHDLVQS